MLVGNEFKGLPAFFIVEKYKETFRFHVWITQHLFYNAK